MAVCHLGQDADAEEREPGNAGRVLREAGGPEHDEKAHPGGESEEDEHGRGSLPGRQAGGHCP